MRYTWIVAALGIVGCAEGGSGGFHMGGPPGGPVVDAGRPHDDGSTPSGHDAGGPPSGHDGGGTASGHDAGGPTSSGHDAGGTTTGTDAGPTSSGTDAGTPPELDAGSDAGGTVGPTGVPGDVCPTAIDVSMGGTWTLDTCMMRDDFVSTCGVPGTPDVTIRGISPSSGSTYQIHTGPGWVVQVLSPGCIPAAYNCGSTGDWGVSGATFDPYWYWGIEKTDGSCGMVDLTVTRVM